MTGAGGAFALGGDLPVSRVGLGAMRLTAADGLGAPADRDAALAVLRTAAELGVTHVDTADFYGPVMVNELIREAFPDGGPVIATKVGPLRDERGRWRPGLAPDRLRQAVEANLEHLGRGVLDVVHLRVGAQEAPAPGSLAKPFEALAALQREGLIRHLGISNVTPDQVAEARSIAPVVSVQNHCSLARREDDPLIDALAADGIAYIPYFPLGGVTPLRSPVLDAVAARLGTSTVAVALAWLLQRSPNVLLIPGTSSVAHLRENVAAADLVLDEAALLELEGIAG